MSYICGSVHAMPFRQSCIAVYCGTDELEFCWLARTCIAWLNYAFCLHEWINFLSPLVYYYKIIMILGYFIIDQCLSKVSPL